MLTIGLLLGWAALMLAGTTPSGRSMRSALIERPAAWLNRFTRGQAILAALLMLFAGLIFWIMGEAGLRFVSLYAPESIGLLASVEFTAAIDAVAVAIATAVSVRLRGAVTWVKMHLPGQRSRSRRTQRIRRSGPPANDADGPVLLLVRAA